MANKSLTDLTARTATADSDLLHINSGGTDYKETKIDFLQGDFYHTFANDTLITTQADSLATGRYFGTIASYGHQSETGVPVNSSFYVHLINYGGNNKIIYLTRQATGDVYFKLKASGTWQSDWTQEPTRTEITSINNSLANAKLHNADHYFSNISIGSSLYADLGDIESVFGIPAGSYIVSAFIRGWSGNPGALSLAISSNGTHLYLMCSATGTISSVTVRLWYCATN